MPNRVTLFGLPHTRHLLTLSLVSLLILLHLPIRASSTPVLAEEETKTITFLHFNDLHAHLTPHIDIVPDAPLGTPTTETKYVEQGGLAQLATLINTLRAAKPNSILMNIGDTYHGGVEALYTNGNAIVEPVNALGIDVGVPGNWDFAYGPAVTRLRYTDQGIPAMARMMFQDQLPPDDILQPNFPYLAANLTYEFPPNLRGETVLPPTLLMEVDGVTIGFIGITSDIVPRMHPSLAMGFNFLEGESAYTELINQYAADLHANGADIVVLMSELGLQKDYRLAQIIEPNSVDIFFSAHTHELTAEPLTSASGAIVVEAGNDAYLGVMDVTLQNGQIIDYAWEVIPVDSSIPPDPTVQALVDSARAPFLAETVNMPFPMPSLELPLTRPIDTVVGSTEIPLHRRGSLTNPFNTAFAEALRQIAQTDIAILPGFRFDAVIPEPDGIVEDNTVMHGTITLEDVYRFFPVAFTISTGQSSGEHVTNLVEDMLTNVYSPSAFDQSGGWVDGLSGMTITIDLTQSDHQRILEILDSDTNQMIEPTDTFTVVGATRPLDAADVLASYPGFVDVQPLINPATNAPYTIIDIFITILQNDGLRATNSPIIDNSHTPVWPTTPYIQPLPSH